MSVLLSDVQIRKAVLNTKIGEYDYKLLCAAQLKAVVEWLKQPCREHEVDEFDKEHLSEYMDFELLMIERGSKLAKDKHREYPTFGWFYKHRKDCPKCWADLKGEL